MAISGTSLCLWLPTFELRLELARTPALDDTSVALMASGNQGERGEIRQLSERAGEAGVRPGMRVSRALSLCPSLTLLEPDPVHYTTATSEILDALEGVSPIIQTEEPGVFHIGTDGLERLHGPPHAQIDLVLRTLLEVLPPPLVAAVRVGWAPGRFGARVAATVARPGSPVVVPEEGLPAFLSPRAASLLPLPEEMLERLERLDIHTLGAVGELPLPALMRHFGSMGREARALARGEQIDPVRPLHRPQPIRVSLDFPSPVGEREALLRGVERLIERGLTRPERRDRSIAGLRAGGHLEEGGSWEVEAILREPTARREELAFALRTRVQLSPPPRAVEALHVEFFEFGIPALQTTLFGQGDPVTRRGGDTAHLSRALRDAVRELTLRIGTSPLYRVVEVDPESRIPERRHALMALEA